MNQNVVPDPVKQCIDLEESLIRLETRMKILEDMIQSPTYIDGLTQKIMCQVRPNPISKTPLFPPVKG